MPTYTVKIDGESVHVKFSDKLYLDYERQSGSIYARIPMWVLFGIGEDKTMVDRKCKEAPAFGLDKLNTEKEDWIKHPKVDDSEFLDLLAGKNLDQYRVNLAGVLKEDDYPLLDQLEGE